MSDPRDADRPGSMPARIGRYRIIERVGRGAMGVVYSAHDEIADQTVALKLLIADLQSDPETCARFFREAKAAGRLLHPNIITVFDAGEDHGRSFIAMQLLEGVSLGAYLKRREAVPLERKLDLMIQICEGLAAAHAQGIIHRDLKPANLFVQSDGLLKILDFGVAHFADSTMTTTGAMIGTPDYMSPEQARGGSIDARSDIFSAGSVFYFMLAGQKPFSGVDLPTLLRQLQSEAPPPLGADVPPELAALVARAMAKNPDDRPARVAELSAALVRVRRQFHAETRKRLLSARGQLEGADALVRALHETGDALGLPPDDGPAAALLEIQERFPSASSRNVGADGIPFERGHVMAVVHELDELQRQLAAEVEARRSHLASFDEAQRLVAAGDVRAALGLFEEIAAAYPQSERARESLETCRALLVPEGDLRDARVAELTAAARRAIDGQEWAAAVTHSHQALALSADNPAALALLAEAEAGLARERVRLASLVQGLADDATRAIASRQFEAADAALREAERLQPGAPVIAEVRQRLVAARAAEEAEQLLHQVSVEEIRQARAAFRRGRYDEAVQRLRGFLQIQPQAGQVALELEHLLALRDTIVAAAAAARRTVSALLARAAALADAGSLDEALMLAREGLRVDPTDPHVAAVLDQLLARRLEERLALEKARALEQRITEAAPLITAARQALEHGYVALAMKAATGALRVAPDLAEAHEIIDRAHQELASDDDEAFDLGMLPSLSAATPIGSVPRVPAVRDDHPTSDSGGSLAPGDSRSGNG